MESKNILILLISLTILVNFFNYVDHDEHKSAKKIRAIETRIAKEESLLKNQKDIVHITHNSLFFDANKSDNALLGEFQKLIQTLAKDSGFKVKNVSWGEPTTNEKLKLVIIPIKLSAKSTPHYFEKFAAAIKAQKKIIKIDMLTMNKSRKEISYQMYLFGYKRLNP
jgi:hypothetical protein